jgi:glycosyltransferase involved in cell wall biosynthesis
MYLADVGSRPATITCHDLIAVRAALGEYRGQEVKSPGRLLQRWILSSLGKARRIVCISETTRQQVEQLTGRTDAVVVNNALPYQFRPLTPPECQPTLDRLALGGRKYVLHVGANHWYKNRLGVLHIYSELRKLPGHADTLLVMVGEPFTQAMREYVAASDLQSQVRELVSTPVADLNALYSAAEFLLFPSLEEGFGWPIVEAQAAGCLVVTTDRPPMSEAAGDAAILIDPAEPAEVAAKIQAQLPNRQALVELGLRHAAEFTLERMGWEYEKQLRRVVSRE